jgi:hypothetical protein
VFSQLLLLGRGGAMDSQTNKIMHTLKTECVEYVCVNRKSKQSHWTNWNSSVYCMIIGILRVESRTTGLAEGWHWSPLLSSYLLAIINSVLSNGILLSLGNLAYCMFLVHPVLQYWYLGSLRRPEYFTYQNIVSIHSLCWNTGSWIFHRLRSL